MEILKIQKRIRKNIWNTELKKRATKKWLKIKIKTKTNILVIIKNWLKKIQIHLEKNNLYVIYFNVFLMYF